MVSFWWLPVRTKLSLRKKALSFWSEFFQWLSSPVEEQVWRRFLKSGLLRLSYGSQHKGLLKSFWIFRNFRNPTWYTANIRWGQGPLIIVAGLSTYSFYYCSTQLTLETTFRPCWTEIWPRTSPGSSIPMIMWVIELAFSAETEAAYFGSTCSVALVKGFNIDFASSVQNNLHLNCLDFPFPSKSGKQMCAVCEARIGILPLISGAMTDWKFCTCISK